MTTPRSPQTLRALAHPLRWKLIDLVGVEQTATATRCAQVLGESVGSCSYHLRVLAKYGFLEAIDDGPGRERPWRLAQPTQQLSGDGLGLAGEQAAQAATEVFLDHEVARLKQRSAQSRYEPSEWRAGIGLRGVTTAMTADELREIHDELVAVAQRYADRAQQRDAIPAGAREVRVFVATSVAPPAPADLRQAGR